MCIEVTICNNTKDKRLCVTFGNIAIGPRSLGKSLGWVAFTAWGSQYCIQATRLCKATNVALFL